MWIILLSNIIVILFLMLSPMSNVNISTFIAKFSINSNKHLASLSILNHLTGISYSKKHDHNHSRAKNTVFIICISNFNFYQLNDLELLLCC